MIIGGVIVALGLFGFLIPRGYLKKYYIFVAFFLSVLLMLYNPPKTDDLFRYYRMFDIVKERSLTDLLNSQFGVSDWYYSYVLGDYMQNSRLFMMVLFILSRTGVRELLPMTFGMLTYVPLIILIDKIGKDNDIGKKALCFGYLLTLICVDYRFVSCLRNLSAYAIFALLLYIDLVQRKKKILCFVGYLLLCELHMACAILLLIRVMIAISKGQVRTIICLVLMGINSMLNLITMLLSKLGGIPFISRLITRIDDYYIGRTSYNINGAVFFVGTIIVTLILYWFMVDKNKNSPWNAGYLYLTFFTLGSINQYDVLIRNTQMIVILGLPYFLLFFNNHYVADSSHIYLTSNSDNTKGRVMLMYFVAMALIIASIVFYTLISYIPMQKGF